MTWSSQLPGAVRDKSSHLNKNIIPLLSWNKLACHLHPIYPGLLTRSRSHVRKLPWEAAMGQTHLLGPISIDV